MPQTLILSSMRDMHEDARVVATPLDAILQLESSQKIATIVLAGSFATDELVACLGELYPSLRIERQV
jgi:hypothetical protein